MSVPLILTIFLFLSIYVSCWNLCLLYTLFFSFQDSGYSKSWIWGSTLCVIIFYLQQLEQ